MPGRNHGRRPTTRPTTDFTRDIIGSNNIPFQLLNEIGHGGYGTVWRARNLFAPRERGIFAVKALTKAHQGTAHHAFHRREITNHLTVAAHPNIVTMHGVIQDKENLYLVMDYCPGGTLLDLIVKERAFVRNDAFLKGIFLQLIDAVHYCHERGVFHRDIKPENILFNRERNKVRLTDFGLSTRTRTSQCFGTGTRSYMSPESLNRNAGSFSCQRSDIWSLGVILVNMITAKNPWRIATYQDDAFMRFLRHRNFLRERFPISKAADDILRKIFTPNPSMSIDLVELHKLVQEVDTFFMTDAEIALGPEMLRDVAKYLRPTGPVAEVVENNPPSEGLPIFVVLSSTSDDLSDSDSSESSSESDSEPDPEYEAPTALHVHDVVPLEDEPSLDDEEVGWRRGGKTPAVPLIPSEDQQAPAASRPSTRGSAETSSSTQQDTLSTISNSSGGVLSFFRLSRQQKSGMNAPVRSGPPELSSRQPLSRLAVQVRRVFRRV